MNRHHAHLSADAATAERVGERRGEAVTPTIDATAMQRGHIFFCNADGVWPIDQVLAEFVAALEDKRR